MKYRSLSFSLITGFLILVISCSANKAEKTKYVTFTTNKGDIKIMLYNDTPGHRDNIIKLVNEGFYDGIIFHRILNDFMIQAGDPGTKEGITPEEIEKYTYTIPAEISNTRFHKRGVLAAARAGDKFNPDRNSNGTQFYIVEGQKFDSLQLAELERRVNASLQQCVFYKNLRNEKKRVTDEGDNMSDAEIQEFAAVISYDEIAEMVPFKIDESRMEIYKTVGGAPHLDMQYTVYGEVVSGFDIVEIISDVKTDLMGKSEDEIIIIKAKISNK